MALVKLSTASEISGKVGGNVYARGRYGQYVRQWAKPVNPNTNAQQNVRSRMAAANTAWAALSDVVKADWDTYAAAVPWLNRIGDTVYLTGKTMFVRTYIARVMAGLSMVAAAPTILTMPDVPDGDVSADSTTFTLIYTWTNTQAWNADDGALSIYASGVVAPTVNYVPEGGLRGSVLGDSTTPLVSPQTVTYAPLTSQAGNRVRVAVRALLPDGRVSSFVSQLVTIG